MTDISTPMNTLQARIQVSTNCSLSCSGAILFFGAVATVSLTIAGLFAARGMWPILPFAGLELLLLGVALGLSMRRGRQSELITVVEDRVIVEQLSHRGAVSSEMARLWARVELRKSSRRGHPSRLLLLSHGRGMELGCSLTESARRRLHRRLVELIGGTGEAPEIRPAVQAQGN